MIYVRSPVYRTDSYSNPSRTIVDSWPGIGTADTVYQTEDGRTFTVTGGAIPEGYTWSDEAGTSSNTLPTRLDSGPIGPQGREGPPSQPDYPVVKPEPFKAAPKVRPNFKVVQRPEFHARSHPRR